jgi:hypothetical protein
MYTRVVLRFLTSASLLSCFAVVNIANADTCNGYDLLQGTHTPHGGHAPWNVTMDLRRMTASASKSDGARAESVITEITCTPDKVFFTSSTGGRLASCSGTIAGSTATGVCVLEGGEPSQDFSHTLSRR